MTRNPPPVPGRRRAPFYSTGRVKSARPRPLLLPAAGRLPVRRSCGRRRSGGGRPGPRARPQLTDDLQTRPAPDPNRTGAARARVAGGQAGAAPDASAGVCPPGRSCGTLPLPGRYGGV
jgi:hypothetical protein